MGVRNTEPQEPEERALRGRTGIERGTIPTRVIVKDLTLVLPWLRRSNCQIQSDRNHRGAHTYTHTHSPKGKQVAKIVRNMTGHLYRIIVARSFFVAMVCTRADCRDRKRSHILYIYFLVFELS